MLQTGPLNLILNSQKGHETRWNQNEISKNSSYHATTTSNLHLKGSWKPALHKWPAVRADRPHPPAHLHPRKSKQESGTPVSKDKYVGWWNRCFSDTVALSASAAVNTAARLPGKSVFTGRATARQVLTRTLKGNTGQVLVWEDFHFQFSLQLHFEEARVFFFF